MSASEPKWSRLDNAAKIFPSTSSKKDPKVFRFSCELTEPVDGQTLQFALIRPWKNFLFTAPYSNGGYFGIIRGQHPPTCCQAEGLLLRAVYSADRKDFIPRQFFELSDQLEVYLPLPTERCTALFAHVGLLLLTGAP